MMQAFAVAYPEPLVFKAFMKNANDMLSTRDERIARMFLLCMCRSHRLSCQPPNNAALVAVAKAIDSVIPLQWSTAAMHHFPAAIRDYYKAKYEGQDLAAAVTSKHMAIQDKVSAIAKNTLAAALYNNSTDMWPAAKDLFLHDTNRHLFFCVIMYNMGQTPNLNKVYEVMQGIPLQELSTCVSNMTDYTCRVLNRTGDKFELYLQHFMQLMENIIWTYV